MERFIIQIVVAGALYFLLQKYIKLKPKSEPNTNGLHIASILACASLITFQKVESDVEFLVTKVILFISYFVIGYVIGYAWRKFRPIK